MGGGLTGGGLMWTKIYMRDGKTWGDCNKNIRVLFVRKLMEVWKNFVFVLFWFQFYKSHKMYANFLLEYAKSFSNCTQNGYN